MDIKVDLDEIIDFLNVFENMQEHHLMNKHNCFSFYEATCAVVGLFVPPTVLVS